MYDFLLAARGGGGGVELVGFRGLVVVWWRGGRDFGVKGGWIEIVEGGVAGLENALSTSCDSAVMFCRSRQSTCLSQLDDLNNVDESASGRLSRRTNKGDNRETACSGDRLANDRHVDRNLM